jgi:hypothetical protein
MRMISHRVLILAAVVALSVAGVTMLLMHQKRSTVMPLADLVAAFAQDRAGATARWHGQAVTVTGIAAASAGEDSIILNTGAAGSPLILCNSNRLAAFGAVSAGNSVTVTGVVNARPSQSLGVRGAAFTIEQARLLSNTPATQ